MAFCHLWGKNALFQQLHQLRVSETYPITKLVLAPWGSSTFCHTSLCEEEDAKVDCLKEHPGVSNKVASLLRQHGRAKELFQGHLLHTQIIILGHEETTFLANSMIEMYGNCGQVNDAKTVFEKLVAPNIYSFNIVLKALSRNGMLDLAREIFWKMPCRDVVSWSTMIGGLSQLGHYGEALIVYCQMVLGSITPDTITFVCVLDACSNLALLKEGMEVHAYIVYQNCESDVVVGTALINLYGKCGCVLYAVNAFHHMPTHDTVCWNALMTAYAQNGHSQGALFLLGNMLNEGIEPTSISFLGAVDACAGLCLLKEGQRIHVIISSSGVSLDSTLQNALLNMYGKCGSLYLAGRVFESMPLRNSVSWATMVTVLSQNEKNVEALSLYDDMRRAGVGLNSMTFVSALNACTGLGALEGGQSIHNTIVVDCVCSDNIVETFLIHMYGKCRSLRSAKKVFWGLVFQDVFAWNVMIASLIRNNHSEDALEYFNLMLNIGVLPDDVTYASALDACACVNDLLLGLQIHTALIHDGYQADSVLQTTLVSMYGRCGDLQKAKNALASFPAGNLAPMNALLSVLTEKGYGKEALDFFHSTMLSSGVRPDKISFVHAINACATLGAFEDGRSIHDMLGSEYEQDLVTGTALISMYGKCGSLLHAMSVYEKLEHLDLVLCNALISASAQSAHIACARMIFHQMQGAGIKPDHVTFISILTACSHAGEIEEGGHLFVSISNDHGLNHSEDHYVCMIDILGRAGNLDGAEQLMNCIPCDVSATMWLALLGACQMHGDLERGWLGARECSDLDPPDASIYVLMSNISVTAKTRHCQG